MLNTQDYIETNGASLTVDIKDIFLTGEEAQKNIKDLILKMELEDKNVILSHPTSGPRITVRVKGEAKKIQAFCDAILNDGKYCIIRKISLAY